MQGQLVAIFNMVLVIGGAFMFGYKAVEYSLDTPDITKVLFGFYFGIMNFFNFIKSFFYFLANDGRSYFGNNCSNC